MLSPIRWTASDVAGWLGAGAGERLAFSPAAASAARLAETLIALANAHGGVVVIGVATGGRLTGVEDAAAARALFQAAGLLSTPPLILSLPQIVEHNGRQLYVGEVPPGLPHVYNLGGRYLTRAGPANRLLTASELSSLLFERGEAGFEAQPVPAATLDDLEMAHVRAYLSCLAAPPAESWERVLLARGGLTQGAAGLTPTYAGVLLFGRDPQRFVRGAEITLVRYAGLQMGDEFVRHDARGALPEQIRQAEAFVTANMRRGMRLSGFTRQETTEYPLSVVREAIVNAAAHRDYAIRGDSIRVLMFSDRLEVYSPGRLPGHVTLDNLLHERFSRNEIIVQALSDVGFVERLGYGIDRMMVVMAEAGLPAPVFEETVAGFRVTLRGRGDDLVSAEPAAQRWANYRVNPRQERALAYLAEHGSITNREFRDLCPDLSDETIRRELAGLVDQGLIMKVGERKATYYILK